MTNLSTSWRDRKVVVTGGAGFLGSNLCHALSRLGARVSAIDAFLPDGGANPANLDGIKLDLVRADMGAIDLRSLLRGAEVIFNLAAKTSHTDAQGDPLSDAAMNVMAQLHLIAAVRDEVPGAVVVHASTRQLYGRPRALPVTEDHPVAPPDANSISKLAGEQYWMLEHRMREAPVVSLRLTNCYGPRLRIRDGRQNFLGRWIGQVLRGEPFEVWGGEQLRDLTFVDDVVAAFLAAAERPACHGRVFNIGGTGAIPLRDIADLVVRISGKPARYTVCDFPKERARIDIGSYHANDTAFRNATGWSPAVELSDGLQRSIAWFRRCGATYL